MTVRAINKNIRELCSWHFLSCSALNLDPSNYHRQIIPVGSSDVAHGGDTMVKCAQTIISDDTSFSELKRKQTENVDICKEKLSAELSKALQKISLMYLYIEQNFY